jgi:hypothetical protein
MSGAGNGNVFGRSNSVISLNIDRGRRQSSVVNNNNGGGGNGYSNAL